MTAAPPSAALRLVRLLRPGSNPLGRGVDRLEAAVLKMSVLLALLLVPVMLTVGTLVCDSLGRTSEQQAAGRHETVAVLTEDAPAAAVGGRGDSGGAKSKVPARWQLPSGATRTGRVTADSDLKAGARVSVWLDGSGRPVDPPLSATDVVAGGVLVVVVGYLGAVGLLVALCAGLHHALDRRRYRTWDDEWARGEPGWHDHSR